MDLEDYGAIVSGIENNGSYTIRGYTDCRGNCSDCDTGICGDDYQMIVFITESVHNADYLGEMQFVTAGCRNGKKVSLGQASKSSLSGIYHDELKEEVACIYRVATEYNAGIQVNEPV